MASFDLDPKSGNFHIRFRYAGKPFKRSLKLIDGREAQRVCDLVEETLKDLKRGRLQIPEGADEGGFLISGGKVTSKPLTVSDPAHDTSSATVGGIFDAYEATLTPGSKAANTITTEAIHGRHLRRVLGSDRRFDALSIAVIQGYVNARRAAWRGSRSRRSWPRSVSYGVGRKNGI